MVRRNTFRRGRWRVERERSRIEDARPRPPFRDATPLAAVLEPLMKRLGLEESHWLTRLAEEWDSIVGPDVGRHTRPGRYRGRQLIVYVDSAVWLNEISRYGRKTMLRNLQDRVGAARIRDVSLAPDPEGPSAQR